MWVEPHPLYGSGICLNTRRASPVADARTLARGTLDGVEPHVVASAVVVARAARAASDDDLRRPQARVDVAEQRLRGAEQLAPIGGIGRLRRVVVDEATDVLLAPLGVVPGVQDEVVPHLVELLGGREGALHHHPSHEEALALLEQVVGLLHRHVVPPSVALDHGLILVTDCAVEITHGTPLGVDLPGLARYGVCITHSA